MKRHLFAACVAAGLVVGPTVGVGAADKPAKTKPADAKSYDEATKAFPVGEKMVVTVLKFVPQVVTKTVVVGDKVMQVTETVIVPVQEAITVIVPERKRSLGVEGWHDKDGFNVDKVPAGGPLTKVTVKDGNKDVVKAVAAGDVITKIDGKPVTTDLELYLAVQGAADGEKVRVEVSCKDGTGYEGFAAAKKAK